MDVQPREGESFESMLRRFKQSVERAGILREYRKKLRFRPAHEVRREKARAARRRRRRSGRRQERG